MSDTPAPYPGNVPPTYGETQPQPYYPPQQPPTYVQQPPAYNQAPPNVVYTNGPPQPVMQTIVVEQHRVEHHHVHWGEVSQPITCQFCAAQGNTIVTYESGLLTWGICGVLVLVGCWLGCCFIPFCVDGTKDVYHLCPHCKKVVGKKSRL